MKRPPLFLALLVVAIGPMVDQVQATPVTYTFQVTATSGPLIGTTSAGTFTFDNGIIPPGGGAVDGTNLLTNLSFVWNGIPYNQVTANTGRMIFDPSGKLSLIVFGNNCDNNIFGECPVTSGFEQWFFLYGDSVFYSEFIYSVAGVNSIFSGTVSLQQVGVVQAVPTLTGWAMIIMTVLLGVSAIYCLRTKRIA